MPVLIGKDKNGCYARFGEKGHRYYYTCGDAKERDEAKKLATIQGIAIGEYQLELATTKVSYDYDGTLEQENVYKQAQMDISNGLMVYIVTARQRSDGDEVIKTARELGIPMYRVIFTGGHDKWQYLQHLGIDMHYDNNQEQIDKIRLNTKIKAIKV